MKISRILSFFTASAAALSTAAIIDKNSFSATNAASYDNVPYVRLWGDANCDGVVDIKDSILIMRVVDEKNPELLCDLGRANADVYYPGSGLTTQDADKITAYLAKNLKHLPYTEQEDNEGIFVTLWGDVNCDGDVSMSDIVCLEQFMANEIKYPLTKQGKINADVFQPGSGITGMDLLCIQRSIANLHVLPQYTTDSSRGKGDLNADKNVDAADASMVLVDYSIVNNSSSVTTLSQNQESAADVNGDGTVDPSDASIILMYYSYAINSTENTLTFEEYLKFV